MEKLASDGAPISRSLFWWLSACHCTTSDCFLRVWKNVHRKLAVQKINFRSAKLPSLPSPEELCSPLTLCLQYISHLNTSTFITPSGPVAPFLHFFPQIRQVTPHSEIWHKRLKFQTAKTLSTNFPLASHTVCPPCAVFTPTP